jgi:hypothetical protein
MGCAAWASPSPWCPADPNPRPWCSVGPSDLKRLLAGQLRGSTPYPRPKPWPKGATARGTMTIGTLGDDEDLLTERRRRPAPGTAVDPAALAAGRQRTAVPEDRPAGPVPAGRRPTVADRRPAGRLPRREPLAPRPSAPAANACGVRVRSKRPHACRYQPDRRRGVHPGGSLEWLVPEPGQDQHFQRKALITQSGRIAQDGQDPPRRTREPGGSWSLGRCRPVTK